MFHPITSFVTLVECVPAHTNTFISVSKSQISIEVSSNYRYVSFAVFCVLLDHQFDALAVDHDCGGDGTFVDVFCVNYS